MPGSSEPKPSPGMDGRGEKGRQNCPWIHKGQARGATGRNLRGGTPGVSRESTCGLLEGNFGRDGLEARLAAQAVSREPANWEAEDLGPAPVPLLTVACPLTIAHSLSATCTTVLPLLQSTKEEQPRGRMRAGKGRHWREEGN